MATSGFAAEAQPVEQPAAADVPAGVIGYRVRLTQTFASSSAASAKVTALRAAGFSSRTWYRGWDGASQDRGKWTVNVLTIDPRTFAGELGASYGADLYDRELVSTMSAGLDATAAINAGFFVFSSASGAPGDPAGAAVYDGVLESEPVGDRPVLVLPHTGRGTNVVRPAWHGTITVESGHQSRGKQVHSLDGINRFPGLIRNCGGTGDLPTDAPLHDVTCTDPDELVAFTTAFDTQTPAGPGREVVVDRKDRVVHVAGQRGTSLHAGERSVQATGSASDQLAEVVVGDRLTIATDLTAGGKSLVRKNVSVVNGGPELVRGGRKHVTQRADGMVRDNDPSFAYGWALQRNPRTFAGVDGHGRTLLITVDGRQTGELGLSIDETAELALTLGLSNGINLDGGGSTAMVLNDQVVTSPSDGRERTIGDMIYVR
ncbi:phosphodiester glycosidase family protein [Kribbella catacumbae]|uniref:phosphodiester glycosidase family protein n=1 Tax=Kribbella catacumbae TaxID=460086 RepID=UPI00037380E3|nr:phosphodiester glycosidase family protein [Kribbella catacumbae]